jgi:hypothetical protein
VTETRVIVVVMKILLAWGAAATIVAAAVLAVGTTHVQAQIHRAQLEPEQVTDEQPSCFGAASRDPLHPCRNVALSLQVVPAPMAAREELNAPCQHFHREQGVSVCEFGAPAAGAAHNIALIGDSHASHWRAPLDAVARERGWHGLSATRTSCPFSTATKLTPEPTRSQCTRWVKALPGFFRSHPEVDTVFVSAITGGRVTVPKGRTKRSAKVNGYRNAWRTLPDTVKHIVVIRDSPKIFHSTIECIDRAIAEADDAGDVCAVRRRSSLQPDPAVLAARAANSSRVQVIDLTPVLCSTRQCFPVIGGALVFKDLHHFTLVFAETLAAPLATAVRRTVRSW